MVIFHSYVAVYQKVLSCAKNEWIEWGILISDATKKQGSRMDLEWMMWKTPGGGGTTILEDFLRI